MRLGLGLGLGFGLSTLLILALSVAPAFSAPFLVCDPQSGVEHYRLTGGAWVPRMVASQPDGSLRLDVATASQGTTIIDVQACTTETWNGELATEVCSDTVNFSLTRSLSALPQGAASLRLVP